MEKSFCWLKKKPTPEVITPDVITPQAEADDGMDLIGTHVVEMFQSVDYRDKATKPGKTSTCRRNRRILAALDPAMKALPMTGARIINTEEANKGRTLITICEASGMKTMWVLFNREELGAKTYLVARRRWGPHTKDIRAVYSQTAVPRHCPTRIYDMRIFIPQPWIFTLLKSRLPYDIVFRILTVFLGYVANRCVKCTAETNTDFVYCLMCRQRSCCTCLLANAHIKSSVCGHFKTVQRCNMHF